MRLRLMTIEEPEPGADIDWETICTVDDQAGELSARGQSDARTFLELWGKAKVAARGHQGVLETLRMLAPRRLVLTSCKALLRRRGRCSEGRGQPTSSGS